MHEWLNWSPINADGSYVWPPYRTIGQWLAADRPITDWAPGDQFVRIKQMGFDFVRLSVDPGPLLATSGDKRQQALDVLRRDVEQITSAGLKVVINLHPAGQNEAYGPDVVEGGPKAPGVKLYEGVVADVTRMLLGVGPDKAAIEPFNEPAYYPCTTNGTGDWQKVMASTVKSIRAVSSDMTIIATGACGGDVTGLIDLHATFDDPNVLYSFHMYDPHAFTHQRIDKLFASGLPWPPSTGTPDTVVAELKAHMDAAGLDATAETYNLAKVQPYIDAYFAQNFGEDDLNQLFAQAANWAKANKVPASRLFMGEFGAILMSPDGRMGADNADRLRYIADVRQEAEKYAMPWATWEYSNPYGMSIIVPTGPAVADSELLAALGLPQ